MGRFILADLRRLWAGSGIMVLLIAMAVALGVGITLQERALRLGSARASEKFDLVIGARGSETQLVLSTVFLQPAALPLVPGAVLAGLQDDPRVLWAEPVGFGDFHKGYPVVGTTTRLIAGTTTGLSEGRLFAAEGDAVIGAAVALAPGEEIVPSHGEAALGGHDHEGVRYRVTGRLQPTGTPWDRAILVPIQAVWHVHGLEEAHGTGEADHEEHEEPAGLDADAALREDWTAADLPGIPAILVKPASIADAYKLRQEYRVRENTNAVFPAEVLTGLYALLGDARQVLAAVAGAAQGLVAAALLLVAVVHIGQRRRQIGALRALGVPSPAIFLLVWTELFALVCAGIALGFLGGVLGATLLSRSVGRVQGFDLPIEIAPGDLAGLAILLVIAALVAAAPAWAAYRQSPVASLRA